MNEPGDGAGVGGEIIGMQSQDSEECDEQKYKERIGRESVFWSWILCKSDEM